MKNSIGRTSIAVAAVFKNEYILTSYFFPFISSSQSCLVFLSLFSYLFLLSSLFLCFFILSSFFFCKYGDRCAVGKKSVLRNTALSPSLPSILSSFLFCNLPFFSLFSSPIFMLIFSFFFCILFCGFFI
jgi:hypothetical protein